MADEKEKSERSLAVRLRYEQCLAACSRSLIAGGRAVVDQALLHLLEAADVDRAYIFESFRDPSLGTCWRQVNEVCAPGVAPQIGNPLLQRLPVSAADDIAAAVRGGEPFHGDVAGMSEPTRNLLAPQGIRSVLLIPLPTLEDTPGFIGFDATAAERRWSEDDVRLLRIGAEMIGVYLGSQRSLQAVGERQAAMDSLFRAVPVGIAVVHGRTFFEVNDAFCRLSGYGREELLGMSTRIVYATQEDFERAGVQLRGLQDPAGTVSFEGRLRRKDGTPIEVLTSGAAIVPRTALKAATIAVVDLTAVKRAEEERRRLEAQVQEGRRHESIGVLAGGIAHDFNNLLMAILGNVDLLLAEPRDAAVREGLAEITRSAQRAAELTRQLLDYSGRSRLSRQPMDLSAVLRDAVPELSRSVDARAVLSFELADGLPPAAVDPGQIRQMIRSLLANAADAAVDGRVEVAVRTGAEDLDDAALSHCTMGDVVRSGRYLYVEVSDTGCGMDADTVSRVFEPFFTTRHHGRGLGLAAVLGIARVHGGCIRVWSLPGRGTTIRVYLPPEAPTAPPPPRRR